MRTPSYPPGASPLRQLGRLISHSARRSPSPRGDKPVRPGHRRFRRAAALSALGPVVAIALAGWTTPASAPGLAGLPAAGAVTRTPSIPERVTSSALPETPNGCPRTVATPAGVPAVDGLGVPALRTSQGLYAYPTGACGWDLSHGPDTAEDDDTPGAGEVAGSTDAEEASGSTRVSAGASDPGTLRQFGQVACSANDRFVAIYAMASDDQDDYAQNVERVRDLITQMDGKLNLAAYQSGEAAHYRFACDQPGRVTVRKVRLSLRMADANFMRLIDDLQSKGFNRSDEKYLVHYAARLSNSYAGQGSIRTDSSDSPNNANNFGPRYAFSYDRYTLRVYMHEVGHTLGAVQDDAPDASGNKHCRGGNEDIMCYNDGGSHWTPNHACGPAPSGQYWDWCSNDYFAIRPRSGYLASHYNIADCYQRWTVYSWCGEIPKPAAGASRDSRGQDRRS